MSDNVTAFVLGLQSAYEGEHAIFGLLGLANLAKHPDPDLQIPSSTTSSLEKWLILELAHKMSLDHPTVP
jgi:hypothetical protein